MLSGGAMRKLHTHRISRARTSTAQGDSRPDGQVLYAHTADTPLPPEASEGRAAIKPHPVLVRMEHPYGATNDSAE